MPVQKKTKQPRNWDAVRIWNKGGAHKRTDEETGREKWRDIQTEEEEMSQLEQYTKQIMHDGPTRVVINKHGEATTMQRALVDHGILADIIYIRSDGWSLGAPQELADIAESLWKEEWIGVLRRPDMTAKPY
jgi:hypothetical protein